MSDWTQEREDMLRKLWADGLSASQIGKALGGVTRNAVIGKIHRLGLLGRGRPTNKVAKAPPRRPKRVTSRFNPSGPDFEPIEPPKVVVVPVIPPSERVPLLELTDKTCRWPIGDPGDEDFGFCGKMPLPSRPYCEHHARIAYQSVEERRKARRAA